MKNLYETSLIPYKICGIYLIKIVDRLYVGSAINIASRMSNHRTSMKKGTHKNKFVQSCYNKHGQSLCYFTVLEECDKNIRLLREQYWINQLSPELNLIKDPTTGNNCITTSKVVYQYNLNGNYLKEYVSAQEAGRVLNINGNTITKCCTGNYGHKSCGKSLWSYEKHDKLLQYTNHSNEAKNKAVTLYDKSGIKIKRFISIAEAARFIQEPSDEFDSLCASISSVCNNKGVFVKHKYMFTYTDQNILIKNLNRNYPIIQILPNGDEVLWNTVIEASIKLNISAGGIRKVLRQERKRYIDCVWKIRCGF